MEVATPAVATSVDGVAAGADLEDLANSRGESDGEDAAPAAATPMVGIAAGADLEDLANSQAESDGGTLLLQWRLLWIVLRRALIWASMVTMGINSPSVHTRTRARTQTHANARTHARTQTHACEIVLLC